MKKTITPFIITIIFLASLQLQAQVLIAKWTFPTGAATDSLADGGLPVNLDKGIHTEGGTSAIDFSKNGATTKAAQATGWDNGALAKCWVIQVNTLGYETLKLTSKQQSGGNNPGPRDYVVQYRLGSSGTWTDVPNSTIVTANDWSTGMLDSILLPEACKDQPSVYLRWLMTTNTNSIGGTVAATGIDKIDDIYITGKQTSVSVEEKGAGLAFSLSPNPSNGPVTIVAPENITGVDIFNITGSLVYSKGDIGNTRVQITPGLLPAGRYLIRVTSGNASGVKQLIVD